MHRSTATGFISYSRTPFKKHACDGIADESELGLRINNELQNTRLEHSHISILFGINVLFHYL